MTNLYKQAFNYATDFLSQANDLPIQVSDDARQNLQHLDIELQKQGVGASEVISELHQWVTPATMSLSGSPVSTQGLSSVCPAAIWLR